MPSRLSMRDRFMSHVDTSPGYGPWGDCHRWTASTRLRGYGQFCVPLDGGGHTMRLAHRVAWFLHYGRWPVGVCRHRCDTPACVNVAHLLDGSRADNAADMVERSRQSQGTGRWNAKLTPDAVRALRARTGEPLSTLAAEFGVSKATVSRAQNRRDWRHVL